MENVDGLSASEYFADFREDEYETQYFGFVPRAFTDGIYNAVYDYTNDSMNTLETYLCQQYSEIMEDKEIKQATKEILKKLTAVMDKYFDKLEIYLKNNVFRIPDNVTLPEDTPHVDYKISQGVMNLLESEINNLKSEIINYKQKKAFLKKELEYQKLVKSRIEIFSNQLHQLKSIARSNGIDSWKDTLTFGVAKADELGAAVSSFTKFSEKCLQCPESK